MKSVPDITEAEWEIMRILWEGSPLRVQEVSQRLPEGTGWHPKTTQTLLNRLVRKKALDYEKRGKNHYYFPLVRQEDCVTAKSRDFLERMFGGSIRPMVAHFIENNELSETEREELQKLLRRRRR